MKVYKKTVLYMSTCMIIFILMISIIKNNDLNLKNKVLSANASTQLSNKKICWGIKREKDHKQPDVGASNKSLIDQYNGICLGNADNKYVYLTFDSRV